MGRKRTWEKSEDEIRHKIRRLEKELTSRQKSTPPLSAAASHDIEKESNCEDPGDHLQYGYVSDVDCELQLPPLEGVDTGPYDKDDCLINLRSPEPDPSSQVSSVVTADPSTIPINEEENIVPAEILAILGEAKNPEEKLGPKIPTQISERWGKIIVEGLVKEQKDTLLAQLLVPENFTLTKAPKLNPEIVSVLTEPVKNRDKRLEKMQNQLGSSIAGIAQLTCELLNQDVGKMEIIKKLSEVNQILLDLHFEETMNRRKLIIPILDKSFINIIQGVKRDKFLFGDNLCENIKNTKTIERSSLQIKRQMSVSQSPMARRPVNSTIQGNLRVPPRQASGLGTARAPAPHARYYQPPPPLPPLPPLARRPPPPPPPPGPRRPPQSSARPLDRRNRR